MTHITVPTFYQNETCLFLYQFTKNFFENIVLIAQDTSACKYLVDELHQSLDDYKNNCLREGETLMKDYIENTLFKSIHVKFEEIRNL